MKYATTPFRHQLNYHMRDTIRITLGSLLYMKDKGKFNEGPFFKIDVGQLKPDEIQATELNRRGLE